MFASRGYVTGNYKKWLTSNPYKQNEKIIALHFQCYLTKKSTQLLQFKFSVIFPSTYLFKVSLNAFHKTNEISQKELKNFLSRGEIKGLLRNACNSLRFRAALSGHIISSENDLRLPKPIRCSFQSLACHLVFSSFLITRVMGCC